MRVVCLNAMWIGDDWITNPEKNEIYCVVKTFDNPSFKGHVVEGSFFQLQGLNGIYNAKHFRPVDTSFGEIVCSVIEEELQTIKLES